MTQTDHDLLIRLHERMGSLEKHIMRALENTDIKVGSILNELKKKLDTVTYEEDRKEVNGKLRDYGKRIDNLETAHLVSDTKKQVYFDIAGFTWKHYVQIGLFITTMAAILRAMF